MFNESKQFMKSKVRGSKGTALANALEKKKNSPKEMNRSAHKRIKREGIDFNKI